MGDLDEYGVRDILGIFRISGTRLDREYLERWASQLGVRDLLQRAMDQA